MICWIPCLCEMKIKVWKKNCRDCFFILKGCTLFRGGWCLQLWFMLGGERATFHTRIYLKWSKTVCFPPPFPIFLQVGGAATPLPPPFWNLTIRVFSPPLGCRAKWSKFSPPTTFSFRIKVYSHLSSMSPPSRRLQTKPVITCLKTFLISYSLIFWVSWADTKWGKQQAKGATMG